MATSLWKRNVTHERKWKPSFIATHISLLLTILILPALVVLGILLAFTSSNILATFGTTKIGVSVLAVSPIYVGAAALGSVLLLFILLLRQNELAVVVVVLLHIYVDTYIGISFAAPLLASALLVVFFLAQSSDHPWIGPLTRWVWTAFIVVALLAATRANTNFLYKAEYYVDCIVMGLLMFWLGNLIACNSKRLRRFFQLFALMGTLIAIHTLIEAITGVFLLAASQYTVDTQTISYLDPFSSGVHRAESFLTNANTNGGFMALILFLPLGLFATSKQLSSKVLYLAEIFLILAALLFTYTTGAWIASVIGLLVFITFVGRFRYRIQIAAFLVLIGIVVVGWFPELFQHATDPNEVLLRSGVWQTGLRVIQAFPLTGLGLGRDVYLFGAEPYRVAQQYIPVNHPHNSYLEFAALGGIPLLLIFLTLLALNVYHALRNWSLADVASRPLFATGLASVTALSFHSMSNAGWTLAPLAAIGWLLLGTIASPLMKKSLVQGTEVYKKSMPIDEENASISNVWQPKLVVVGEAGLRRGRRHLWIMNGLFIRERLAQLATFVPGLERMLKPAPKTEQGDEGSNALLKLLKSSGIYALGFMASPLINLVLAPFLTRHLSRAEYGGLAVINAAISLMAGITQLGIGTAFLRVYNYDYESQEERSRVLSTTIILLLLVGVPICIAMIFAAPWLSIILLGGPEFSRAIQLAAAIILLQNLTLPGYSWLRAENHATFLSLLMIGNLVINLSLTIVLVGILHMGIIGSLIGVSGGYALTVVILTPIMLFRAGLRLHMSTARNLLSFGLPIVASFIAVWILQLSDRYLLSLFKSLSETASYSVAYSLGGVLAPLILGPFNWAWPPAMYSIAKRKDAPRVFQQVFRWFSFVLLFATFGLSLLSIGILNLLFPPSYHMAAPIIPIITASMLFYGVYEVFTLGVYIQRKTWLVAVFTACSALLNLGLNLVLIPSFGAMGAALSTLLAYMLMAVVAYVVTQHIYAVPFEIGLFSGALLLGIALYFGSSFLVRYQGPIIVWCVAFMALLVYGITLIMLGIVASKRRQRELRKVVTQENIVI